MMNVLNGGAHADNSVDMQEFMIVPAGAADLREAVRCGAEVFHALKAVLAGRGLATAVGDEGGFAPDLRLQRGSHRAHPRSDREGRLLAPADDVHLALDVASSELYRDGEYHLASEGVCPSTPQRSPTIWPGGSKSTRSCPIEDGMAEDDWEGWKLLNARLGGTDPARGRRSLRDEPRRPSPEAESPKASRTRCSSRSTRSAPSARRFDAIETARSAGWTVVVSHRSGETEDTTIADLAVATGAGQIKTGSLSRSDRVAKYNRLIRIEERLAPEGWSSYPGLRALHGMA